MKEFYLFIDALVLEVAAGFNLFSWKAMISLFIALKTFFFF